MLYVRFSKSLYGMLRAALLFYNRLRNYLENMGFKINPYDPCVANKMVNGHQMTIYWHVDDLKVSHKDNNDVTVLAEKIADLYGPKTTISRGKVHEYLGMDIDWASVLGKMIVSMIKYLHKLIEEFPEFLRGTKASPAGYHMFTVREDGKRKLLPEEQARQFHRIVAHLIFLCKHARPDIESLILFLTTSVKYPDEDDWGKLKHGLIHMKGTRHMKRHMKA